MIFILAGLLIIIYSLQHYKKGLCIYLAFKLLLVTNITLISLPGLPLLTLEDFMNMFFVCYFILMNRKRCRKDPKFGIPWQMPFIGLSISFILSSIFAVMGFTSEISAFIKFLFGDILLIWTVWECLRTERDFRIVFKLITVVIFASCIYGLIEYEIKINPLQLYEMTLNHDSTKVISFVYSSLDRGYRINSIFEHAIGAGMNWSLYFGFVIYHLINKRKKLPFHLLSIITAGMCLACVLLTKMRSPLIFTIILCFGAFNFKKRKSYIFILLAIIVAAVFLMSADKTSNVLQVILSLFQSKTTSSVGGSSLEMRIDQMVCALNLMKINPVVGLGTKYQSAISAFDYSGILGSEGLLLYVLPCFGILGIVNYIYYFWVSMVRIPMYFKSKQLAFLFLAYLITYLVSSVPGLKIHLLYLFAFWLIKTSDKYRNYTGTRKVSLRHGELKRMF